MLPFLLVIAMTGALQQFATQYEWSKAAPQFVQLLQTSHRILVAAHPFIIVISMSYYLGKNLDVNSISSVTLAMLSFMLTSGYGIHDAVASAVTPNTVSIYHIVIPLFTTYSLAFFLKTKQLRFIHYRGLSQFLSRHINLIVPYALVFICSLLLVQFSSLLIEETATALGGLIQDIPLTERLAIRLVLSHLFWFLGIHGDQMLNFIDPTIYGNIELFRNLTAYEYGNTFIYIGGSGACWGLAIACLLQRGPSHEKFIAKIALPTLALNISEILIFALPIVFNPLLLAPFVLNPLLNFIMSQIVLSTGWIMIQATPVEWITPALFDSWILSKDLRLVGFQALLIAMNTAVYYPFVKRSIEIASSKRLAAQLGDEHSVSKALYDQTERQYIQLQTQNHQDKKRLSETLTQLEQGELQVWYQPKINTVTMKVSGFEALIRLQNKKGDIQGPWFLETLRQHQLTHIIDLWVIERVAQDIESWKQQGLHPNISINLEPTSISAEVTAKLVEKFEGVNNQIEIEIVESSYIKKVAEVDALIDTIEKHGMHVAIDDFGTGYSNISTLSSSRAKTIKLDRSLLSEIGSTKGYDLYLQLIVMCKKLGYKIVAEGVETQEQLEFLRATMTDELQGWYFSKALPFHETERFLEAAKKWESADKPGSV